MPQCWFHNATESWAAFKLEGQAYRFVGNSLEPAALPAPGEASDCVLLHRRGAAGKERWLLLAPAGSQVYVNGDLMQLGVRQLRDRDEILVAARPNHDEQQREPSAEASQLTGPQRVYFSTERLAEVVPLPGGMKPVFCVRCKRLIEPGTLAVRCPAAGCGLWHHETTELPCWTYAPRCAMCPQPTALDVGFLWTPAQL